MIDYNDLAQLCVTLHTSHHNSPSLRKAAISLIRNGIFDCRSIHSGFVSKRGQHLNVSQLVKEHFHPRQASAHKIFDMLDNGASLEEVTAFIIKVCHVHYVTKEENNWLIPFQKLGSGYNTPEEQYEAADIELVPYLNKNTQKYVYIIDGIEYKNSKDAAIANSCKQQDVYNRCKSSTKRFAGWIRKEIL